MMRLNHLWTRPRAACRSARDRFRLYSSLGASPLARRHPISTRYAHRNNKNDRRIRRRAAGVVGNWKNYSLMRPAGRRRAEGRVVRTSRTQQVDDGGGRDLLKAGRSPAAPLAGGGIDRRLDDGWIEARSPARRQKAATAQETSTLVSAESIRKLFRPAARRRRLRKTGGGGRSIFCCFASHALRAYTVRARTPERAFSAPSFFSATAAEAFTPLRPNDLLPTRMKAAFTASRTRK